MIRTFMFFVIAFIVAFMATNSDAQFICPTAQTGMNDTLPEWTQNEPPFNVSFIDSNYATCFKRITNAAGGTYKVPLYSELQAFNADGTKLLLKDGEILNVNSWTLYKTFPYTANGMKWSPIDPNVIFYIDNSVDFQPKFKSRNIVTDVETTHRTFTEYEHLQISRTHHEISADGRMVALIGNRVSTPDSWDNSDIFAYDIIANRKHTVMPARPLPIQCGNGSPDEVGMSPSGKWIVVVWGAGTDAEPNCGFAAYDTAAVYQGKIACGGGHYDFAVEPNGTEWLIFPTAGSGCSVGGDGTWNGAFLAKSKLPNGRDLYKAGDTSAMVKISDLSFNLGGIHVSAQARWYDPAQNKVVGLPWVIVSADLYGNPLPRMPYDNEIVRVFLDSKPLTTGGPSHVERLADTRSQPGYIRDTPNTCVGHDGYWAQPHATVSRDGTRIVWGSSWGSTYQSSATTCKGNTYYMDISRTGFNNTLVTLPLNTWTNLNPDAFKYDGTPSGGDGKVYMHDGYSGGTMAPEWGSFFLFGGGDHSGRLGNDVWRYDTETNKMYQYTLPDSSNKYPSNLPNRHSFRSYVNYPLQITPTQQSLTHTKPAGSSFVVVADPLTPVSPWNSVGIGATLNGNPWSSHSYDQMAWNSRERKMLYWGTNYCSGFCMGRTAADDDSLQAGIPQHYMYMGAKSAHKFDPFKKTWANFTGNQAPDLYHQTGATAYDPVNKVMLAVNRSRWASTGGGGGETQGSIGTGTAGRAAVQDTNGVWTVAASPPFRTGTGTWSNATLTYVKSTGTFYSFRGGAMYQYNAASNVWSTVTTIPDPVDGDPGIVYGTSVDPYTVYSSKDNKIMVRSCREQNTCIDTWILDVATGQWDKANPPSEPFSSTTGDWFSPTFYDPINNVFLTSVHVGGGGNVGNGDTAVTSGGRGALWAYKISSGSGAGTPRIGASAPPSGTPCSSNP